MKSGRFDSRDTVIGHDCRAPRLRRPKDTAVRIVRSADTSAKGATTDLFLTLVTTGSTSFMPDSAKKPDYGTAVALDYFLKKYDCQAAITQVKLKGPSLPPSREDTARLLIAMHLDLPDAVEAMIDKEPHMFKWLLPSTNPRYQYDIIDYAAFKHMPPQ